VGGISQWLKHGKNGLLVRAGNISGFTKAIDSILGSPQKAQSYAGAAVETVKECYNRDLHNQTLFDPLNNLIKQKRSNR
jgi:glycosyltransferase involved in cell wall biosynthesis